MPRFAHRCLAVSQAGVSGEGPGTAAGLGVLVAARFRTR